MDTQRGSALRLINAGIMVGLPVFLLDLTLRSMHINLPIQKILSKLMAALFFMWLTYNASKGFKGLVGKLLENSCLVYLGKISYGLYIFHNFMPGCLRYLSATYNFQIPESSILNLIVLVGITIVVASASWHLVERPINYLKVYFNYETLRRAPNS
jgi:peptidoglycan/LPS O-acetylase OafA/YrhL